MNGRVDRDYKFEKHTIRGLDKMTMFITVTFLVYMGMAKAKILAGEKSICVNCMHKFCEVLRAKNRIEGEVRPFMRKQMRRD